ncbi:MAG: hypothetical protein GY862_07915 [Gammaproteobacteria bacterium]|nr:hypothetical protein [Gammaproteobacteria bacterium]
MTFGQLPVIALLTLAFLLVIGLQKNVIKSGLLSRLSLWASERVVRELLAYGFLLALPALVLTFMYLLMQLLAERPQGFLQGHNLPILMALLMAVFLYSLQLTLRQLPIIRAAVSDGSNPERDTEKDKRDGLLLPWLPNRENQKSGLRRAVQEYQTDRPDLLPPLLCIIHGDDCEHAYIHEHLWEYLNKQETDRAFANPLNYHLDLGEESIRNTEELHHALHQSLALEDFRKKLRNGRQAIIVYGVFYTSGCFQGNGDDWLTAFTGFWRKFQGNIPCLLMICVKYTNTRSRKTAERLQALEQHSLSRFREEFGLPGLVLPRLQSISHEDAAIWTDRHSAEIRGHCKDIEWLREQIEQFYNARQGSVCMRPLGLKLKELLKSSA